MIFSRNIEADPASREELLAQECGYDDDMIRRLRELLKANEATNGFDNAQPLLNAAGGDPGGTAISLDVISRAKKLKHNYHASQTQT